MSNMLKAHVNPLCLLAATFKSSRLVMSLAFYSLNLSVNTRFYVCISHSTLVLQNLIKILKVLKKILLYQEYLFR